LTMPTEPNPPTTTPLSEREQKHRDGWLGEDHSVIKFRWEHFVTLEGTNRIEAIQYLADRDLPLCVVCDKGVVVLKDFDVDHIDKVRRHNKRWNMRLKHHSCNSSTQNETDPTPAASRAIERERTGLASVGASSELVEGVLAGNSEWSVRMNAETDDWLGDLENGPFALRTSTGVILVPCELKKLARMGAARLKRRLGRGSQTTVERYLWARSEGEHPGQPGELKIEPDSATGLRMVTYRGKNRFIVAEKKESA
jgi:hypothetical protein